VARLIFGASDPKAGAAGSAMNLLQFPTLNHRCAITSGVREAECRALLQSFFAEQRSRPQSPGGGYWRTLWPRTLPWSESTSVPELDSLRLMEVPFPSLMPLSLSFARSELLE